MRRADLISGGLVVAFGLLMIFAVVPAQINSAGDYGLDPKFFPVVLLWLVTAMGLLLVATRIPQPPDPPDTPPVLDHRNWIFIAGATVFLLLSFIAIRTIGYIVAGAIMIALLMVALELRRGVKWFELAAVAILAPTIIYYLLYTIFSVQLPTSGLMP